MHLYFLLSSSLLLLLLFLFLFSLCISQRMRGLAVGLLVQTWKTFFLADVMWYVRNFSYKLQSTWYLFLLMQTVPLSKSRASAHRRATVCGLHSYSFLNFAAASNLKPLVWSFLYNFFFSLNFLSFQSFLQVLLNLSTKFTMSLRLL